MVQSQPPLLVDIDLFIISLDILLIKPSKNSKNAEPCYAYDISRGDTVSILEYTHNYTMTSRFSYTNVVYVWSTIRSVILTRMHQFIPEYRIGSHNKNLQSESHQT